MSEPTRPSDVPTVEEFADFLERTLEPTYELIYITYYDDLSDTGVRAVFYGDDDDWEAYWDSCSEWEADNAYQAAGEELQDHVTTQLELLRSIKGHQGSEYDDVYHELLNSFENSEHQEGLIDVIRERDEGSWFKHLVAQEDNENCHLDLSGDLIDDDTDRLPDAKTFLERLGIQPTPSALAEVEKVLNDLDDEVSEVYACFSVSLLDMYELPHDCTKLEIGPFVLLVDDEDYELDISMVVRREDLCLDRENNYEFGGPENGSKVTPIPSDREVAEALGTIQTPVEKEAA